MKVKALKSFAGAVSMHQGEVRDIATKAILDDLIAAGYVEPVAKRGGKDEGKRDNAQGNLQSDPAGREVSYRG